MCKLFYSFYFKSRSTVQLILYLSSDLGFALLTHIAKLFKGMYCHSINKRISAASSKNSSDFLNQTFILFFTIHHIKLIAKIYSLGYLNWKSIVITTLVKYHVLVILGVVAVVKNK